MSEVEIEEKKSDKKVRFRTILSAAGIIILVAFVVLTVMVYAFEINHPAFEAVERVIPYPAAFVGYKVVTLRELKNNVRAVKQFYENQDFSQVGLRTDFSTEDGKQRLGIKERGVLNKMIEDRAIEVLARKYDVVITDEMVKSNISRKLQEFGSEQEVKANLANQYGWDLNDFSKQVVKPSMYKEGLEKYFNEHNNTIAPAEKKIQQAKEKLDGSASFGEVAGEFSEGATAKSEGELGWFRLTQFVPEVSAEVSQMTVGERSGIIKSELGFHIVELQDKKKDEEEGELFRIRQIFVRTKTFVQWLEEEMARMKIAVLLPDYNWNSRTQMAEFSDEEMQKTEARIIESSQGDASLLFLF